MTEMKFWRMALPFILVNAVVWGVASIALPVLAGSDSRAGLVFAMLNLGLAIGAFIWGYLSRKVGLSILLFSSTLFSAAVWVVLVLLDGTLLPILAFALRHIRGSNMGTGYGSGNPVLSEARMGFAYCQDAVFLGAGTGDGPADSFGQFQTGVRDTSAGPGCTGNASGHLSGEEAAISRFVHSEHHIPKGPDIRHPHGLFTCEF